jgi:tRNA(His) 5'-end guanylyltransferase
MGNKKDSLGDRMKDFYENRTRIYLPRRTYTIIRVDGKSFHTYTKGLQRPFDEKLINDMDETAAYLCKNIQGAKCAFVQSDEISILLTDFDNLNTDAWFDGNIQKITSISASLATAKFNELRPGKIAIFDSRVFTIPSNVEVENYFIWRQQDTVRNSIQSVAQSLFSHKELENKNGNQLQEMIFQKGINWNDYPAKMKRGRLIVKDESNESIPVSNRSVWVSKEAPTFTQEREIFDLLIPKL